MTQPYLCDRSRILAFQQCPRYRWHAYEWEGRGLSPVRSSIPLTVGVCVHEGLAHVLEHFVGREYGSILRQHEAVEMLANGAVDKALSLYDEHCRERQLEIGEGDDQAYVYLEQRALIEALIRGWCIARLPSFLEEYEVVEVEREEELELVAPQRVEPEQECPTCKTWEKVNDDKGGWKPCPTCNGEGWLKPESKGGIIFMARADGLLRNRRDNNLYILSFKTAAKYDERTGRDNRYDMQGMSELAAIEARLQMWWEDRKASGPPAEQTKTADLPHPLFFRDAYLDHAPPKIMGVQMEYLLKGDRKGDYDQQEGDYSGPKRQNTPLIRPYTKQGILSSGDDFAWKYKWKDDYGKRRQLGKGWSKVNIWEVMPIKEWIELLATGEVQGEAGDCLTSQFVSPPIIYRSETEIEDWKEQITAQELNVQHAVDGIASGDYPNLRRNLNTHFPQHRRSCTWPTICSYVPLCHEGLGDNPIGSGLYQLRRPHHKKELAKFALD